MVTNQILLLILVTTCTISVICNAKGSGENGGLVANFYGQNCSRAEEIVQTVIKRHVSDDPSLPAKLLRLYFHDCVVRGCDASVLLSSTENFQSEQESGANRRLGGFEAIDDIKAELEKECQGIVSCADILALATRDAVSLQYGRPLWEVPTGRRDGTISSALEASRNIPTAFSSFNVIKDIFRRKGLSIDDLVALSGAHTIGVGRCSLFSHRLYNFTGKGDQDPSINPSYADFLRTKCGPNDGRTTVEMDPESSRSFDNHYYEILKDNKGLFTSDATLLTNKKASKVASKMLDSETFFDEFAKSMLKMGAIEVLTGTQGQIRKKCNSIN